MTGAITAALLLSMTGQIDRQLDNLGTMVICEHVDRYAGAGNLVRKIDSIETTVEVIDGVERYSHAEAPGTWSFGELATLLHTTRDALKLSAVRVSPDHAVFHLPASSRRWFVSIDSRVYWLDITGEVTVSDATGELLAIRWISNELPASTGVAHIIWTVSFRPSEVGGHSYLLPDIAEYRVTHRGTRSEWNITRFQPLGRYGSELSIDYSTSSDQLSSTAFTRAVN